MNTYSSKPMATSLAIVALTSLAWIKGVSADIAFAKFAPGTTVAPGQSIVLNWTINNANVAVPSTEPFDLTLRALSGQRYNIQRNVSQTLLRFDVVIPKEATGGFHSFYAGYTDGRRDSSNQFNVTGPIVTTPSRPDPTDTVAPGDHSTVAPEGSGGLSGAALGGIIGGVTALFLIVALVFFIRNRRHARERSQHTRLEDTKESYSETSTARSGPPPTDPLGGGKSDGMVAIPLSVATHSEDRPRGDEHGSPRSQQQPYQLQHVNGTRNPFEGPEEIAAAPVMDGATSLSPRQQHQPYQPPPRPTQQQPYGGIQQNSRGSVDSEPESAYDPNRSRVMPSNGGNAPIQRNNSNPVMRGGPPGSQQLHHSASSRSIGSDARQNMSPRIPNQNPFQDRELMSAAAIPAGSPALAHSQLSSPVMSRAAASPRMREIEMQPLDVQQHQYEQQMRALQRQQQQQQQQQDQQQATAAPQPTSQLASQPVPQLPQPPQPSQPSQPVPQSAQNSSAAPSLAPILPSHPFNPTLYDDKTEVDEDGAPVYNGYRDTIFGAYAQPVGDDDDEETPVPAVPASVLNAAKDGDQNQQQDQQTSSTEGKENVPGITRKKSVKFVGVPASGPIEVPAAAQDQAQMYHSEGEEDEDYEDEDDIKKRLMETEARNSAPAQALAINTANQQQQETTSNGGFIPPPPTSGASPLGSSSSSLGDGFYEDVLAAVDKNSISASSTTPVVPPPVPQQQPIQQQQQFVQQQHIPAPQPQHLQPVLIENQVFGAPSPRMKPAGATSPTSPSSNAPALSPRSIVPPAVKPQHADDEEAQFYESSLL
ncbi:hypothetical protein BX616_002568 [Lobosporangium transversale]|uniref:Ser-Thr-rich glycosyl-phosphatidyl-inositol-anchored membrane family-domain-containing protein n=1 Tax=Lobosporangium transversale TaxID=64571 RepID=A0A1Y2H215_9FUNG|nr:hypothetical protein BCR41DRAFT_320 [Lobosporangium transversale]KAF9916879.1 hypothetical protein BX616_002568 [Lobosporangium transversale]ORZ28610.1 hypothetical protein BCR41DRAFT_320 [Lobosporangium transversale]|eukprot:XP_021886283.1 hypothetical protein BCR41DRAFT_320 [Lobosporangium transversale]